MRDIKYLHPSFPQPSNSEIKVWRYISIAKLVDIIRTQSLYLSRIDKLNDPHEGTYAKANALHKLGETKLKLRDGTEISFLERRKRIRRTIYVNCWRVDDYESEAMWKLYCPNNDGIAIQTTYDKLAESVIKNDDVYVGLIKYLDYENETFDPENIFNASMHKRKAFEHEKEVRVVKPVKQFWNNIDEIPDDYELRLPWQIDKVIDRIYINPYSEGWYYDIVRYLLDKFEVSIKIEWSGIRNKPYY